MKRYTLFIALCLVLNKPTYSQNWLTAGNNGLTNSNFLGTTDNKSIIFKTKNKERGRLLNNGNWRFGTAVNNVTIDSNGALGSTGFAGSGYRPLFVDSAGTFTATPPANWGATEISNPPDDDGSYLSIPDNSCTGTMSTITLSNLPIAVQSSSITVTISVRHNNLKDLVILIVAPNGDKLNLVKNSLPDANWGDAGHELVNTGFNDHGSLLSDAEAPYYSGVFKPEGNCETFGCNIVGNVSSFSAIAGGSINPNGTWTLRIFDTKPSATGELKRWKLSVNPGAADNDVWKLNGNIGTDSSSFIGTIDNRPLLFKINNLKSGMIGKNGNVSLGKLALLSDSSTGTVAIGDSALYSHITGNNNIAIGYKAGYKYAHGSTNIYIGSNADASLDNLVNATAIGYNTAVRSSHMMMFGNSAVRDWGFGSATPAKGYALAVGTSSTNGNGAKLTDGGVWTNASDKNLKEDFQIQSAQQVLDKVKSLSITKWRYKGTSNEYHIGPVAQDFYTAFNLGVDDKSISTIDPAGVALLAIQALSKQNDELKSEITELKSLMQQLQQNFNNCNPCGSKEAFQQSTKIVSVNNASLQQNIPNPFNNTTTINYALPQIYSSAKIIIVDKAGKLLKEVSLAGNGNGSLTIDASTLTSGAYSYSLYVNGKFYRYKADDPVKIIRHYISPLKNFQL